VLGLYCPDLPPIPGGVSDHTVVLARALETLGHAPAVIGRRGEPWRFARRWGAGIAPRELPSAARDLEIDALIIQYVPFLYARLGVSPSLVRAVRALTRAGTKLSVIVHEPYVPLTRLPWIVTGPPMRWQFRAIVREAGAVYTPVPRYADLARRVARQGTAVSVAPVGATLPVSKEPREAAREALGIADGTQAIGVFSPAAAGFASHWVRAAASRLGDRPDTVWLVFGYGQRRFAESLPTATRKLVLGDADPAAIGRAMRALDLAVAPYQDGLTFRRSGAMLALAHGVPLVSSTGPLFDPDAGGLAACEATSGAFADRVAALASDPAARAQLVARTERFEAVASVNVLARMIVSDLAPRASLHASPTSGLSPGRGEAGR
jgi:glycosyltransferase involved in cell wall biosynthesis